MSDHSEDIREEDSVSDTTGTASFLSEIIRPVIYNSNSHTALLSSSFLTSAFTFPIAESMHIIDESIRGYIQFSLTWKKDEKPLDFIPLEKIEDYYPEEIEEELILPYYASNNRATIERKVTSYSSNLAQGTEVPAVIDNTDDVDDDSFGRSLAQAASSARAQGLPRRP